MLKQTDAVFNRRSELEAPQPDAADDRSLGEPVVAVVIPVFKQPGFLQDAVHSVLRQTMRPNIRTVIVNDGCPYPSTDEFGRLIHSVYPKDVIYLHRRNGGLSSARNHGIRFALNAWPSVQAIFPLDSDNVLSPETIEKLWQSLANAPEAMGWAYHDLNIMGTDDAAWRTTTSFSVYRLAHENLCDAGALIHRRVFESGVWYDETMKRGYEDWEFFLHAALEGFGATHVADTGFFYRRNGHSMLTDARQEHDEIYQSMMVKHGERLRPHRLTELEHREMPRFALVELDQDRVRWTTNPHTDDQSVMSISDYIETLAEWETQPRPKAAYIPPVTVISHRPVFEQVRRLRMLPGLLSDLQTLAAQNDCAFLNVENADRPNLMTLGRAEQPNQPVVLAIPTRRLIEVGRQKQGRLSKLVQGSGGFARAGLTLSVGLSHVIHAGTPLQNYRSSNPSPGSHVNVIDAVEPLLNDLWTRLRDSRFTAARQQSYEETRRYAAPNAFFAAQQQLSRGAGTFPYFPTNGMERSSGTGIWFAVPWLRLGGVDQIVLNLARQLRRLVPDRPINLAVTSVGEVEATPEALDPFDTITFLAAGEESKEDELVKVLVGADVILNAHSQALYDALPKLRGKTGAPILSLLQLIDPNAFGVLGGYPVLASRQYAQLIDHLIVPSKRLKRTCINFGVPEEKVAVVPNSPATRPPSLEAGFKIANTKARRIFSADHPLRILFAGRFDEQKGFDRLAPILSRLDELGVPFDFQAIGKPVLSSSNGSGPLANMTILPPAQEPAELARHYTDADVFLLPSRWEGVPLTVLEAMSFAAVVIATSVGAIDEVIEHGTNGFLIDPDLPELEVTAKFSDLIAGIARHELAFSEMRANAVRTAMSFTWQDSAERLAALIEPARTG